MGRKGKIRRIISKAGEIPYLAECLSFGGGASQKRMDQAEYLSGSLCPVAETEYRLGEKRLVKVSLQLACIHYEPLFLGKRKMERTRGLAKVLKDGWQRNLAISTYLPTLNRIVVSRQRGTAVKSKKHGKPTF